MSMDQPNEYEQAIENYAAEVRKLLNAQRELRAATEAVENSTLAMQSAWRVIIKHVAEGHTKPGVYRINKGPGQYAEAILIGSGDYPDLLPMFR